MSDELDEVLAFLAAPCAKKVAPAPAPEPEGESIDEFAAQFANAPKISVADPQSILAFVRSKVRDANESFVLALADQTSEDFFVALFNVPSARARFVRDLILRNGSATTSEIAAKYDHPPRAACDLSDAGIPLRTERTKAGVRYTFDPQSFEEQLETRGVQPARAVFLPGRQCALCPAGVSLKWRLLQVDHRIPFALVQNRVARAEGDAAFQALCVSHNAEKRQACSKCKCSEAECRSCYYAYPESYTHIAGQVHRVLTVVATSAEALRAMQDVAAQAELAGLHVGRR